MQVKPAFWLIMYPHSVALTINPLRSRPNKDNNVQSGASNSLEIQSMLADHAKEAAYLVDANDRDGMDTASIQAQLTSDMYMNELSKQSQELNMGYQVHAVCRYLWCLRVLLNPCREVTHQPC